MAGLRRHCRDHPFHKKQDTGGRAVAVAMVAAAALPLLVGGAYADCYNYCFNDCMNKDKSMRDYCSYACDKTCAPDAAPRRPVAGLPINCQLACVRDSCSRSRADANNMKACYGQCYDRCETMAGLPRPLRAGGGVGIVWPAALPDHPFHKKLES
uniref:Uncharacterized protein n=1 Tax=Zea mays TaxID=4577 RepID=B6UEP2_MAIZE|nr:hypothetical protein [Zea mays]